MEVLNSIMEIIRADTFKAMCMEIFLCGFGMFQVVWGILYLISAYK